MIPELLKKLRKVRGVSVNSGATAEAIEAFQKRTGVRLTDELLSFYRVSDGMGFDNEASKILSLDEAAQMKNQLEEFGIRRSWEYLPITEDNTSNPVCVGCREPLAGYLVQVFHDDSPKIKWRSLPSLLEKMPNHLEQGEWEFEGVPSDFVESERTEADVATARKLLAAVRRDGVPDVERTDGCIFAAWLFGEDQISEIAALLDTEDEYVRREICERLRALETQRADEILRDYDQRVQAFVKHCGELLQKAGLRQQIHNNTQLEVVDGPFHLNMDSFYSDKTRSDFATFFVGRVRQMLEQKKSAT